jgi:chromosomal replication initiator protein
MIQKYVADQFEVEVAELLGSKRNKQILIPRQVAMYLCRKIAKISYPEIGEKFGGKDHSTVINSCQKIEKMMQQDEELRTTILALEMQLQQ